MTIGMLGSSLFGIAAMRDVFGATGTARDRRPSAPLLFQSAQPFVESGEPVGKALVLRHHRAQLVEHRGVPLVPVRGIAL